MQTRQTSLSQKQGIAGSTPAASTKLNSKLKIQNRICACSPTQAEAFGLNPKCWEFKSLHAHQFQMRTNAKRSSGWAFNPTLKGSSPFVLTKILEMKIHPLSLTPHPSFYVGCSSIMAEHRTVNAVVASSNLVSPPNFFSLKILRHGVREVRDLVVNQADDGSSPFHAAKFSICVSS